MVFVNAVLAFALDRCQAPVVTPCNNVDTDVAAVPPRPLVPRPDLGKVCLIEGVSAEHLSHKRFEGSPSISLIGILFTQTLVHFGEAAHSPSRKAFSGLRGM